MPELINYIYRCYLGEHLIYRTAMIQELVEEHGASFFYKYSTDCDSIINFIMLCEDMGLFNG